MLNFVNGRIAIILAAAAALSAPTAASAAEVALTLNGQGITFVGEFVGFRDYAYIIKTSSGEIHVPAVLVSCEGENCISFTAPVTTVSG